MTDRSERPVEVEHRIRAHEAQTAEQLAQIRALDEQWDEYRQVMRQNTVLFEQAGTAMGAKNYVVEKSVAARRELDGYVGQLAHQQSELLVEAERGIRSASEGELEQLRHEKASASWG